MKRATRLIVCLSAGKRAKFAPYTTSTSVMRSEKKDGAPSTPLKDHFEYRNAKVNRVDDVIQVDNDDELQPQWKALEHRITRRVHKKGGPSGRSKRNSSAWDAECV